MEKGKYNVRLAILIVAAVQYLLSIIIGSQGWSNIASPVVTFAAAYIIWENGRKREIYRTNWILLALLAFTWGVADSFWMVAYNVYGLDPEQMPVFTYIYLIPNMLLVMTTMIYFIKNIKKWYNMQLLLDIIITVTTASFILWHLIVKYYDIFTVSYDDIISTFLYMLTDSTVLAIILVLYSSARVRKPRGSLRVLLLGICIYSISDLYYIFLVFRDAYIPNTLIDFLFVAAIALFAIASLLEAYKPVLTDENGFFEIPQNIGRTGYPVLLWVGAVFFYITGHLTVSSLAALLLMILLYQFLSSYVQGAIRNVYLLKKEKQMTESLEGIIAERTSDLVAANKALNELIKTDTLTGLHNRRFFLEELDRLIGTAGSKFALLYMDLDRFKVINDTHGHEMGDKLLKIISDRLNWWMPGGTVIARLGGDEFAIMLKENTEADRIAEICQQIIDLFSEPIVIDSYIFNIGVSIGVSRYPLDADDRDKLTKYADIAMYNAKKAYGAKRCALYNPGQSDMIERSNEVEILLKNADFDSEFELNFQPQFDINSNCLIGAEALLRWNSPAKGRIPPGVFIPIAEENGIILDIGKWVMDKAMRQIAYWNNKYGLDLVIGINISPRQVDSIDFVPSIKDIVRRTGTNTAWIDFEITENSAMNTNVVMEEILTELSEMGISISIDDFGTGYSSLSYIKRFDIDRLKIAKELIDNISSDKNTLLIVKAIIAMVNGMGLRAIAEGVETEEQLSMLRIIGCNEVQGYLLGRPLAAEAFEKSFLEPLSAQSRAVQNY